MYSGSKTLMMIAFNRTILELKVTEIGVYQITYNTFNRTILELKVPQPLLLYPPPQTFNRTILELKDIYPSPCR